MTHTHVPPKKGEGKAFQLADSEIEHLRHLPHAVALGFPSVLLREANVQLGGRAPDRLENSESGRRLGGRGKEGPPGPHAAANGRL